MGQKAASTDPFKNLTWNDLEDWAGSVIVSRGQNYQRYRHVQELVRTPDGGLIAWVQGTERYATLVQFDGGELVAACTCPYGATCKHAVAVVLEYLHLLKQKKEIPEVSQEDRRLPLLDEKAGEKEWDEDEEDDEREDFKPSHLARPRESPEKRFIYSLEKQTKGELLALLKDLAGRFPAVREALKDREALEGGNVKKFVSAIRREIHEVSSEPGWRNNWSGEGYTPDYSGIKDRLEALLAKGHADDVISLGKAILKAGKRQVEMSHDEGDTGREISSCLEVVFRALPQSSLPPVEQMLWAVNASLEDDYDLCYGAKSFWEKRHKISDWNALAGRLLDRLNSLPSKKGEDDFSWQFHRDKVSNWVIHALDKAGQKEEILSLCRKEVEITGSYLRLVEWLRKFKKYPEAEEWISKGIKATRGKWLGIAAELRTSLREMREEEGNWLQAASFRAEDFFQAPSLATYKEMEKAAQKAKVWPEVRSAAVTYLETGKYPEKSTPWPLPQTGITSIRESRPSSFPATGALIDIAMAEKRTEDVLHWYDQRKPKNSYWQGDSYKEDQIATAIAGQYPDRAVAIWKKIAGEEIALTKPKAYEAAAVYLRKAQRLMGKLEKKEEWQKYIAGLRRANERKRRFVEILDRLEDRPILRAEGK
jgi:uncharacterized Zn finger protein